LIEFLVVGTVRAFDLAIELWRTRLDVCVTDALILDTPMELGLEFVAIIGANFPDPGGKALDNMVNEGDGIGLGVPAIDVEGTDAGRVGNGCVLVVSDRFAVLSLESQELHIDLDLVTRNLLLIQGCMNLSNPRSPRERVQPISTKDPIDPGIRDLDAVITH